MSEAVPASPPAAPPANAVVGATARAQTKKYGPHTAAQPNPANAPAPVPTAAAFPATRFSGATPNLACSSRVGPLLMMATDLIAGMGGERSGGVDVQATETSRKAMTTKKYP